MKKRISKKCPHCNQNITPRDIQFYSGLIEALFAVCVWCGTNKTNQFVMKDIRDLLKKNEYARFGDLIYFADIVKKTGKSQYQIDLDKARNYFYGRIKAPLFVVKDPVSGKIIDQKDGFIYEIKKLADFLDDNQLYRNEVNQYENS